MKGFNTHVFGQLCKEASSGRPVPSWDSFINSALRSFHMDDNALRLAVLKFQLRTEGGELSLSPAYAEKVFHVLMDKVESEIFDSSSPSGIWQSLFDWLSTSREAA